MKPGRCRPETHIEIPPNPFIKGRQGGIFIVGEGRLTET